MKRFDIIYAKFVPRSRETYDPMLLEHVGKLMKWQASSQIFWGPHEGQWCFHCTDETQLGRFLVSEEDLEVVEGPGND